MLLLVLVRSISILISTSITIGNIIGEVVVLKG